MTEAQIETPAEGDWPPLGQVGEYLAERQAPGRLVQVVEIDGVTLVCANCLFDDGPDVDPVFVRVTVREKWRHVEPLT
jgi:hypothetical protein